jgi:N-formylglutamate amidohydrolase
MSEVFTWREGDSPLLVSIPHDGREIPAEIAARMTAAGRAIPDTDWHVRRLYEFAASLGASVIAANYSRYVVDLNRPPQDDALYPGQVSTGLCPAQTFSGEDIYADGRGVDAAERQERVARYWEPYHAQLARKLEEIRKEFGYALLWDAHSIRNEVPRLFQGKLPELNLGTNDGRSCAEAIGRRLAETAGTLPHSWVLNGRFKGGYITRHYGRPTAGIHAVQLEIAQRAYMDEDTLEYDERKAARLAQSVRVLLAACRAGATIGAQDAEPEDLE